MKEMLRKRVMFGDTSVLEEFTPNQLEDELDKFGWNAYHFLAQARKTEVLTHIGAFKLRNKSGETAVEILLKGQDITREKIEKLFPWYTPTENETIEQSVENIKNTSNAEKFILQL